MVKKAYKSLDLKTKSIFTSRDVVFHENIFPFHMIPHTNDVPLPTVTTFLPNTQPHIEPDPYFFDQQTPPSPPAAST